MGTRCKGGSEDNEAERKKTPMPSGELSPAVSGQFSRVTTMPSRSNDLA